MYWVDIDKHRPMVVVSSWDVLAVSVWQTHVVPLTSNVDRAGLAGNVFLPRAATSLRQDSVAVPLGLELVDRQELGESVGVLPFVFLEAVDRGVRQILGL